MYLFLSSFRLLLSMCMQQSFRFARTKRFEATCPSPSPHRARRGVACFAGCNRFDFFLFVIRGVLGGIG